MCLCVGGGGGVGGVHSHSGICAIATRNVIQIARKVRTRDSTSFTFVNKQTKGAVCAKK